MTSGVGDTSAITLRWSPTLRDLIDPDFPQLPSEASLETAHHLFEHTDSACIVIHDGLHLAGVLTRHRLQDLGGLDRGSITVGWAMARDLAVAQPGDSPRHGAELVMARRQCCLPLVDGERLIGVVPARDLIGLALDGSWPERLAHRPPPG